LCLPILPKGNTTGIRIFIIIITAIIIMPITGIIIRRITIMRTESMVIMEEGRKGRKA
jgi:cytochrome b subunit of formate dehydrogenase